MDHLDEILSLLHENTADIQTQVADIPAATTVALQTRICATCHMTTPMGKFCLECGAKSSMSPLKSKRQNSEASQSSAPTDAFIELPASSQIRSEPKLAMKRSSNTPSVPSKSSLLSTSNPKKSTITPKPQPMKKQAISQKQPHHDGKFLDLCDYIDNYTQKQYKYLQSRF